MSVLWLRRCAGALLLAVGTVAAAAGQTAAAPPALLYKGTMGQQRVTLWLEVDGDALRSGHYRYDSQASDIQLDEVRVFGNTAVLADADGNTMHLHMRSASGNGVNNAEGTPDWTAATLLEGTLVRDDLDLPVKLERVAASL